MYISKDYGGPTKNKKYCVCQAISCIYVTLDPNSIILHSINFHYTDWPKGWTPLLGQIEVTYLCLPEELHIISVNCCLVADVIWPNIKYIFPSTASRDHTQPLFSPGFSLPSPRQTVIRAISDKLISYTKELQSQNDQVRQRWTATRKAVASINI